MENRLAEHEETRAMAAFIYIANLAGFFIGLGPLIGVLLAHVANSKSRSIFLRTHYKFQIGTFWSAFGLAVLALFPIFLFGELGAIFLLGVILWFGYKSIIGLVSLNAGRPMS